MKYSTYSAAEIAAPSLTIAFSDTAPGWSISDIFPDKDEPAPPVYRPRRAEWTP